MTDACATCAWLGFVTWGRADPEPWCTCPWGKRTDTELDRAACECWEPRDG